MEAAKTLPRRRLGKTDMEVSCIGFGAASLGGVYGDADLDECKATVHAALSDYGINFFDTSPYYGNSEEVLGKCLAGLDRSSFYVATKLGRYGDGPEDYDISAERVRSSVQTSLERLGVGHIDLIQVHDIEFGSLDQLVDETLPALAKLKQEGKVRWVGITSYVLEKLVYVLERCAEGQVDTVQTYARLSLLDNTLLDLGPYLKRRGIGVISGSPLGMSLLSGRPPVGWNSAPKHVLEACTRLCQICEGGGMSLPKLAMQYAAGQELPDTTLIGTKARARLKQNVEALLSPYEEEQYKAALEECMQELKGRPQDTQFVSGGAHNVICQLNVDA